MLKENQYRNKIVFGDALAVLQSIPDAAVDLGIEIGKAYLSTARERLKDAQSEVGKIEKERQPHRVLETFRERKVNGKNTGRHRTQRAEKHQLQIDIG